MPVTSRIDPRERVVYLTITGRSPFEEWEGALRRVLADPAYVKGFNFLTDRRGQRDAPRQDFALKVLRFLVAHTPEMGRYRWAAVTPWPAPFGTLRMFSILAEEADIHVEAFSDYDEARRWLLGGAAAEATAEELQGDVPPCGGRPKDRITELSEGLSDPARALFLRIVEVLPEDEVNLADPELLVRLEELAAILADHDARSRG